MSLKITVGPAVKGPYLELLTSYAGIQAQMKADVEKLPPAFQREVYERISHAYGRARDAGLGQANLTQNLTLLNNALIEVTTDVSNAYKLIALFKGSSAPQQSEVQAAFAQLSPTAQPQAREAMKQSGDLQQGIAILQAFDPSMDQVKPSAKMKVGPAIKEPYLNLLTAYGQIQQKMAADVARLPVAFQREVFYRLSIAGGYSQLRDAQVGQQNLTQNLTVLNDVLIEVTTDVSLANHVAKGNPQATMDQFSPTAQRHINSALMSTKGMQFADAVAQVFGRFQQEQAPVQRRDEAVEHKGAPKTATLTARHDLPPPVRLQSPTRREEQLDSAPSLLVIRTPPKKKDEQLPLPVSLSDVQQRRQPETVVVRPQDEHNRTGAGGLGRADLVVSRTAPLTFQDEVTSTNANYSFE